MAINSLAQAIANIFSNVASALSSAPLSTSPPSTVPGGSTFFQPESPFVGTPIPPALPAPTVPTIPLPPAPSPLIPPVTLTPTGQLPQPASNNPCPVLWPTDSTYLGNLPGTVPGTPTTGTPGGSQTPTVVVPSLNGLAMPTFDGYPIDMNDRLRMRAYGTAGAIPVTFYGRVLKANGDLHPFSYSSLTDSTGTIQERTIFPGEGLLTNITASVPFGSITTGAVFAIAELGDIIDGTFAPHTLLFSGQLDGVIPITIGSGATPTPLNRVSFDFFNETPGVAVPYSKTITPPHGMRMRFTRIAFGYQCSANVGNRFPVLAFRKGGNSWSTVVYPLLRTAGQFGSYESSIAGSAAVVSNIVQQPLNDSLYFYDAMDIQIFDGASAPPGGDTLTAVFIRWELS